MRKSHRAISIASAVWVVAGLSAQQPKSNPAGTAATTPAAARTPAAPAGFTVVASIQEIMSGIVDPTSKVLFGAVAVEATQAGTKTKAPETAADWEVVRRNALMLAEAGNLLKIPGRRAERAGSQNKAPSPENLTPAEIQAAIARDTASYNKLAQGLTDAALVTLKAIDARNPDAVSSAGENIDTACENCHLRFWYPPKKK